MARRLGNVKLQSIARVMCKSIVAFAPAIRKAYPDNTALHLALETAMLACEALEQQLEAIRVYGD